MQLPFPLPLPFSLSILKVFRSGVAKRIIFKRGRRTSMRFLVTGGAGFIGSNIVRRLLAGGDEVVVIDDLTLGSLSNVPGVKVLRGDVRDARLVEEACEGVEGAFHDAARSSAPMFSQDPREGVDVNLKGFMNVAEAARRGDFPVVYASTSSLYGRCKPPHREDMEVAPGSFYEYSFLARERYASLFSELYGVRLIGLRYFSVYGPHEEYKGRFANNVSQFAWDMMSGRAPVVYGDGSQTRDLTYVDDVVEANILAFRSRVRCDVFNVGTGRATSFNRIIELLNGALGMSVKPKYVPNPIKNYVKETLADTSKAERLLGFRAKVGLEEGIRRTVEYYRQAGVRQ